MHWVLLGIAVWLIVSGLALVGNHGAAITRRKEAEWYAQQAAFARQKRALSYLSEE